MPRRSLSDFSAAHHHAGVLVPHRRFCPKCGTQLFSAAEARPHLIFVRAGTLDDPEVARPSSTIWTSQAPSWACIDSDLPAVAVQPSPVS
jgi:hypothetical protein